MEPNQFSNCESIAIPEEFAKVANRKASTNSTAPNTPPETMDLTRAQNMRQTMIFLQPFLPIFLDLGATGRTGKIVDLALGAERLHVRVQYPASDAVLLPSTQKAYVWACLSDYEQQALCDYILLYSAPALKNCAIMYQTQYLGWMPLTHLLPQTVQQGLVTAEEHMRQEHEYWHDYLPRSPAHVTIFQPSDVDCSALLNFISGVRREINQAADARIVACHLFELAQQLDKVDKIKHSEPYEVTCTAILKDIAHLRHQLAISDATHWCNDSVLIHESDRLTTRHANPPALWHSLLAIPLGDLEACKQYLFDEQWSELQKQLGELDPSAIVGEKGSGAVAQAALVRSDCGTRLAELMGCTEKDLACQARRIEQSSNTKLGTREERMARYQRKWSKEPLLDEEVGIDSTGTTLDSTNGARVEAYHTNHMRKLPADARDAQIRKLCDEECRPLSENISFVLWLVEQKKTVGQVCAALLQPTQ